MSRLRKVIFVFLLLCVALGVFLWRIPAASALLFAPASAVNSSFHKVHAVNGTLWRGNAAISTAFTPSLQRIEWQCTPVLTAVALECTTDGVAKTSFVFKPLSSSVHIRSLSAALAIDFTPNPAVNASADLLRIELKDAQLSTSSVVIAGSAVAKNASLVTGGTPVSLGEIFVDCLPQPPHTACTIKNRASSAKIDGTLTLTPARAKGQLDVTLPGLPAQKLNF